MAFLDQLKTFFLGADVSGTWNGSYWYGDSYPDNVRSQQVNFVANLKRVDRTTFKGTAQELEGGIPELSEIDGQRNNDWITFTKTYKSSYFFDDDGNLEKKDFGPQHVIYEGSYDDEKQVYLGEWRIEATYIYEGGREEKVVSRGTWEMKKN